MKKHTTSTAIPTYALKAEALGVTVARPQLSSLGALDLASPTLRIEVLPGLSP